MPSRSPIRCGGPRGQKKVTVVSGHMTISGVVASEILCNTMPGLEGRMQPLARRGVLPMERREVTPVGATPDWESIRLFLEVVRRGSFRAASERLGISV